MSIQFSVMGRVTRVDPITEKLINGQQRSFRKVIAEYVDEKGKNRAFLIGLCGHETCSMVELNRWYKFKVTLRGYCPPGGKMAVNCLDCFEIELIK